MAARRLAMTVIQQCVGKLEPSIKQLLLSLMSGDSKLVNNQIDYHGIIYDLYCCAPQILFGVLPYVTGELLVISVLFTSSSIVCLFCYNFITLLLQYFL
jgi:sister-chromatid-cohesion protein PDS5